MTTPGGSAPDGAYVIGTRFGSDENEAGIRNKIKGSALSGFQGAQFNLMDVILGGFGSVLGAIANTVNDDYIADLATIQNHSQSIEELQAAYDQLILQGQSIVFESNNTYYPSPGITSIDVIIIGAGGGGGGAFRSTLYMSGGGGGGGGEVHTNIPSSLLPKEEDGTFSGIAITIGQGGAAGPVADSGTGGGTSKFGPYLDGGGGEGGTYSSSGVVAAGGSGMIPGGNGGRGGYWDSFNGTNTLGTSGPTNSTSPYDLHGGGGGGGSGATRVAGAAFTGGIGGISAGGAAGSPGQSGKSPNAIIAAGGGGGGGGVDGNGGAGAFPGGGGGGGAASTGGTYAGGIGGNGRLWIIERFS